VIQSNMDPIPTLDVKINGVEVINPKRCRCFNLDRSRMDHRSATPCPSIVDPTVDIGSHRTTPPTESQPSVYHSMAYVSSPSPGDRHRGTGPSPSSASPATSLLTAHHARNAAQLPIREAYECNSEGSESPRPHACSMWSGYAGIDDDGSSSVLRRAPRPALRCSDLKGACAT
jgi:hypothetical protein